MKNIPDFKKCAVVLFVIAPLLYLSGCAKRPPHVVRGEIGRDSEASQKLETHLKEFESETTSLKALVKFDISDGEKERKTDAVLVVHRPDKIRIDAIDSLADVWARAGSSGDQVWLGLPAKGRLYKGRSVRKNLQRLIDFELDVDDLIAIISGFPTMGKHSGFTQLEGRNAYHFVADGGELHLWTTEKAGLVRKLVRYGDGGRRIDFTAEFDDYRWVGKVKFPFHITLHFPSKGIQIAVFYKDVSFGEPIDDYIFSPNGHSFKKVTDLDASSGGL